MPRLLQLKCQLLKFAQDARGVEANRSISQHRDEMQENTAEAEAGKDQHADQGSRGFSPPSRVLSLNPRSATPRSEPRLRSFLVPKTSSTIRRAITQWTRLKEPITVSVPEMGFGAVRAPGGVEGLEDLVAAEDPVSDLVLDENLLLVG